MPVSRQKVKFTPSRSVVAAPASAWGADFSVVVGRESPYTVEGDYAVVEICGPLCQYFDGVVDGYDAILSRVAAACLSTAPTVVLRIDSPGGDFPGGLEAARQITAMARQSGKRLVAFTDSQALSAGYMLACACDEIVITPSAYVGSVGVWAALTDMTAHNRMLGANIVIVPSGERKADRNPNVAITEATVAALQAEVDSMAGLFFAAVSSSRKLSVADVRAHQGASLFGAAALQARLADRIVDCWSDFIGGKASQKGNTVDKEEMRKALAKAAEEGDEKCARALKAWDGDEKEAKAEGEEDEKKASAKSEDEGKEEKKEEAKKAKKAEEKEEEKKAAADATQALIQSLAAEVQAMKASVAAKEEQSERASLLASRPDITGAVRASLEKASLSFVRDACKNWPRVKGGAVAAVAAQTPGGTVGNTQASGIDVSEKGTEQLTDEEYIERKMMGWKPKAGIEHRKGGRELVLGFMSPEDVKAAAARLAAKKEGV